MHVQAINSSEYDRCSAGGLIWELKDLFAINFISYTVLHDPRSCNLVAHDLAAVAVSLSSGAVLISDSIPNCIHVPVANDLASVYE
jgi:hypothetical protein